MAKKKTITAENVLDAYMNYVLTHNKKPANVYVFAQEIGLKESEFYGFYASFEAIEKHVFELFFNNVHALITSDKAYEGFDAKNKLLAFYFTFFETLTANRSYVKYVLTASKSPLEALKPLHGLRKLYLDFIDGLDIESVDLKIEKIEELKQKAIGEAAWGQLLIAIKFWLDDTSPGFEKTDLYIEKSLNTSFELLTIKPSESLIDFGKFLFKEKFASKN